MNNRKALSIKTNGNINCTSMQISMASTCLKYRPGSSSTKFVFVGLPPVQVQRLIKIEVRVRFGFENENNLHLYN